MRDEICDVNKRRLNCETWLK